MKAGLFTQLHMWAQQHCLIMSTSGNDRLLPLSGGRNPLSHSDVPSGSKGSVRDPMIRTTSAMTSTCAPPRENWSVLRGSILHLVVPRPPIADNPGSIKSQSRRKKKRIHTLGEVALITKQGGVPICRMHALLLRPACVFHFPVTFQTGSQ